MLNQIIVEVVEDTNHNEEVPQVFSSNKIAEAIHHSRLAISKILAINQLIIDNNQVATVVLDIMFRTMTDEEVEYKVDGHKEVHFYLFIKEFF